MNVTFFETYRVYKIDATDKKREFVLNLPQLLMQNMIPSYLDI